MSFPHPQCPQTKEDRLEHVRQCSPDEVEALVALLLNEDEIPRYINTLGAASRTAALRACLLVWTATADHLVPREMQIRVILADVEGRSALVSAGTGSGKTLPIAAFMLFDDPSERSISITISPLKRLQVTQNTEINMRFGPRTVVINEDTPSDESWWHANVWSPRILPDQPVQHLIVTVEQLFKTSAGHMPRLGEWLRNKPAFQKLVKRINVDEAHFIYTAGQPLYGLSPFRRAFGQLEHLKRQLPSSIQWHFFSATLPPHILSHIQTHYLAGAPYDYIHITSNRPNIMYATHEAVGALDDLRNYNCFLTAPFNIALQPHVLIFADDKLLTGRITRHLRSLLPENQRDKGIVRYYHSTMSQAYLEQTHASFVSPDGNCRVLVATSGQSVGVDFPNVQIVCNVGLPSSIVDLLQRAGRAGRSGFPNCVFVEFFPSWVLEISLDEYSSGDITGFTNDPDRPRADLRDNAKQRERAPLSMVNLIQSSTCLRQLFAAYLGDSTPSSVLFSSQFCCDRHRVEAPQGIHVPAGPSPSLFRLEDFLPGSLFTGSGIKRKDPPAARKRYRPKVDRKALDILLVDWVLSEADNDPLFRASYEILSKEQRRKLTAIPAKEITSSLSVVQVLDETPEWAAEFGSKIFELVQKYDQQLANQKAVARAEASAKRAADRTAARAAAPVAPFNNISFVVSTAEDMAGMFASDDDDADEPIASTSNTRVVRRKEK